MKDNRTEELYQLLKIEECLYKLDPETANRLDLKLNWLKTFLVETLDEGEALIQHLIEFKLPFDF